MTHPPTWLYAVTVALAVCRLSRMALEDRVPVGRLRDWVLVRAEQRRRWVKVTRMVNGEPRRIDVPPWWGELATCAGCVSVWLAAGYLTLVWAFPVVMIWPSYGLAISAVAAWWAGRDG